MHIGPDGTGCWEPTPRAEAKNTNQEY